MMVLNLKNEIESVLVKTSEQKWSSQDLQAFGHFPQAKTAWELVKLQ